MSSEIAAKSSNGLISINDSDTSGCQLGVSRSIAYTAGGAAVGGSVFVCQQSNEIQERMQRTVVNDQAWSWDMSI